MAGESAPAAPARLMNFVSEEQLDQAKKSRGERADDGTAQRDRPLFEILKENKDKRDAEFNERFKHRPPKALDDDETEFLDKLEMSRRELEQQVADEEAQQLRSFQAAVAAQSSIVYELKEAPSVPKVEEKKLSKRKNTPARPLGGLIIAVKPQAKKAKIEEPNEDKPSDVSRTTNGEFDKSSDVVKGALGGLVSYSDESEGDEG